MTLIDLLHADDAQSAEQSIANRLEYHEVLSRASCPRPDDAGRLRTLASAIGVDDDRLKQDIQLAVERSQHVAHVAELQKQADTLAASVADLTRQLADRTAALEAAGGNTDALIAAAECAVVLANKSDELRCQWLRSRGWKFRGGATWEHPELKRVLMFLQAVEQQAKADAGPFKKLACQRLCDGASKAMGSQQLPVVLPP